MRHSQSWLSAVRNVRFIEGEDAQSGTNEAAQEAPQQTQPGSREMAKGPDGNDLGYPLNTAEADMTVDERLNYYKHLNRQKSNRLRNMGDYDDLKAAKQELEDMRKQGLSDGEKAIKESYEQGLAAGKAEADKQLATAVLRLGFDERGLSDDEADDLLETVNPAAFVKKGQVDMEKVRSYLNRVGPKRDPEDADTGDPRRSTSNGQGSRGKPPRISPKDQGLAEARRRGFIKEPTA